VIHDSKRGSQHDVTELTGRQKVGGPPLNPIERYIKTRTDASSFVNTAKQVYNNFAGTVVVNDLELTNVALVVRCLYIIVLTVLLHDSEELDGHLGSGTDQSLSLTSPFSICECVKGIVESTDANHDDNEEGAAEGRCKKCAITSTEAKSHKRGEEKNGQSPCFFCGHAFPSSPPQGQEMVNFMISRPF
jgi:hypothetical protein